MFCRILLLILLFLLSLEGFTQNRLSGIILDEETGRPVPDSFIMKVDRSGVISDSLGQFTITIDKLPASLVISHVSYGQSEIIINELPNALLVIKIQQMISDLEEVQISAERMRILTEKDDFSIQDFAFDDDNLWMIGYMNNQASRGKLFLANGYGDTILSKRIKGAEELFKDAFRNVHLVLKDSVYQLFGFTGDSIVFLYSADKKEFMTLMEPIEIGFAGKLVYKNTNLHREEATIFYYDESDNVSHFLTHISDSIERMRKQDDILSDNMWAQIVRSRYWKSNTKLSRIYEKPISTPMFTLDDSLYIINMVKDSLLIYDKSGRFVNSMSITFHYNRELGDNDKKDLTILSDGKSGKVYVLERKNAAWSLHHLDVYGGCKMEEITLPNYAGMTNISVWNNAVYFLYPEKKYPYYTRLYRYQLN